MVLYLVLGFENNYLNRDSWNRARFVTSAVTAAGECIRGRRDVLKINGTSLTLQ